MNDKTLKLILKIAKIPTKILLFPFILGGAALFDDFEYLKEFYGKE